MKSSDLMVGDWVLLFGRTNAKVDCIGNVEVYLSAADSGDWRTTYEHIQPILLTPEILQANGIQLVEVGDNGISTPAKFRNRFEKWAIHTEWRDIWLWYDRTTKRYNLHDMNGAQFTMVHELQHALRLAGIQKDIAL